MKAYSDDLRQRIVHAVDQGHRQAEIAAAFQVSVATIKRYLKLRRETGQASAKPIPGRPPKQRAPLEAELPGQLAAHRDITLAEHCRLWEAAHGQRVSRDTMRRAIAHLGWTRKKPSGQKQSRRVCGRLRARHQARRKGHETCPKLSGGGQALVSTSRTLVPRVSADVA